MRFLNRKLGVPAIAVGLLLSGCTDRVDSVWKTGVSKRGDWNSVLQTSLLWKTKYATFESKNLPTFCALAVAPNNQVEGMIQKLGLVEASNDFADILENKVLGSPGENPSVWRECWENYSDGLGFPSSCGAYPRRYFQQKPGAFDPNRFSVGVCFRSKDAVVVVNRNLRLRGGPG